MRFQLVLSSGTGPVEVQRFVALLAERYAERCAALGLRVQGRQTVGPAAAPRSVTLHLEGDAPALLGPELGSHALLHRSPDRGRRGRKRWFASVVLLPGRPEPAPTPRLRKVDVEVQTCRARGPGGQNVNKRSTAVRVVHRATGISVKVEQERTQAGNRREAEALLRRRLEARAADGVLAAEGGRRLSHYHLERGHPVRTYQLDDNGALVEVGPSALR